MGTSTSPLPSSAHRRQVSLSITAGLGFARWCLSNRNVDTGAMSLVKPFWPGRVERYHTRIRFMSRLPHRGHCVMVSPHWSGPGWTLGAPLARITSPIRKYSSRSFIDQFLSPCSESSCKDNQSPELGSLSGGKQVCNYFSIVVTTFRTHKSFDTTSSYEGQLIINSCNWSSFVQCLKLLQTIR